MKEAIINFIRENNLNPFGRNAARASNYSILKTKDAKEVQARLLDIISNYFVFDDTKQIMKYFSFTDSKDIILKRQAFFRGIVAQDNFLLKSMKRAAAFWRPKYDIVVATENEGTLIQLQKLNCPVLFLNSESDLNGLDRYDLVQVIDCENFNLALERLPQAVFVDNVNDIYLERFLVQLSSWKFNLEYLKNNCPESLKEVVDKLGDLLPLIDEKQRKSISLLEIEAALESMNKIIFDKIKNMTLSGESVISILSKGIPREIKQIMEEEIKKSGMPCELFELSIPLKLDERETEAFLKRQSSQEFTNSAAVVQRNAQKIKEIPSLIRKLEDELIFFDFFAGIFKFVESFDSFPETSEELLIENSKNIFLKNPQPISFKLDNKAHCSILTGANSGGKTTLVEHVIQLVVLSQIGLPVSGKLKLPLFTDVYYFAKNKGSMSKGAFETLLTQMSEITPGKRTLILADEIEAVTEPGVAGEIIVSTAEYFLKQNCFLIIATHLGQEIKDLLPINCRIDGIEAKGLTESYELIVDHNPVLGRLANSTPELIIEKMAKSLKKPYFIWLHENLKRR